MIALYPTAAGPPPLTALVAWQVLDYNTILVMGGGKCLEHGRPHELMQRPDSALGAIVSSLGARTATRLRQVAEEADKSRAR